MPPKKKSRTNEEIYELLKEYIDSHEHYFSKVDKLDERVNGNGKPGLTQEMAIAQEREQKRDRREWFIFTVLFLELLAVLFA